MAAPLRRRWRVLALAGVALGIAFAVFGCTSTVRPPAGPLSDPVAVLVGFDESHHGIVLPRAETGWVEYGFGEFGWYAEMKNAWYHAFATVLWPTQGTLGRRELAADDVSDARRELSWIHLEEIEVEGARVDALRDRLDAQFEAGRGGLVRNEAYRMDFVPVDEGFWCLFNCTDAVAEWLEELGCDVSWVPIRTGLEIVRTGAD